MEFWIGFLVGIAFCLVIVGSMYAYFERDDAEMLRTAQRDKEPRP